MPLNVVHATLAVPAFHPPPTPLCNCSHLVFGILGNWFLFSNNVCVWCYSINMESSPLPSDNSNTAKLNDITIGTTTTDCVVTPPANDCSQRTAASNGATSTPSSSEQVYSFKIELSDWNTRWYAKLGDVEWKYRTKVGNECMGCGVRKPAVKIEHSITSSASPSFYLPQKSQVG